MNWLYTIIFSGLMTAGGSYVDAPAVNPQAASSDESVAVAQNRSDEVERFEQTYRLDPNGRVSVANVNGSITIKGWDRNEVKLVAVKRADSKETLASVEIKVESKDDRFSVAADYGDWKFGGRDWNRSRKIEVDFDLMVPQGAVLNEIGTVNGSVTISEVKNAAKISAVNGVIKADRISGNANLSTVNGEVYAECESIKSGSRISLSTVNGRVFLTVPSDISATIKATSVNGSITNDLGLPVRKGKYVGRDLYGRVGGGESVVNLESVNGELKIIRRNDGRSLSPAVNLLSAKAEDDDVSFAAPRPPRPPRAPVDAAEIAAEVAAELARLKPEIDMAAATAARASVKASIEATKAAADAVKAGMTAQKDALAPIAITYFPMSAPRVERRVSTIPVNGKPNLRIKAPGCSVRVTGNDSSEVKYTVTQIARSRQDDTIDVKEKKSGNDIEIVIDAGNTSSRSVARIDVTVPKRSDLSIITDGEIRVTGVTGTLDLKGEDGAVSVIDTEGSLKVSAADGMIRLVGVKGSASVSTEDGPISLDGRFESLDARSGDGAVFLTLPTGLNADITAPSGDIQFVGLEPVVSGSEASRRYRFGAGGSAYRIATEGRITVRAFDPGQ